ncbi:hypothetical protein Lal_00019902 [Lupinus albus]|nr:hypothetical protein Lal_00019902 [Lupinus albus]
MSYELVLDHKSSSRIIDDLYWVSIERFIGRPNQLENKRWSLRGFSNCHRTIPRVNNLLILDVLTEHIQELTHKSLILRMILS